MSSRKGHWCGRVQTEQNVPGSHGGSGKDWCIHTFFQRGIISKAKQSKITHTKHHCQQTNPEVLRGWASPACPNAAGGHGPSGLPEPPWWEAAPSLPVFCAQKPGPGASCLEGLLIMGALCGGLRATESNSARSLAETRDFFRDLFQVRRDLCLRDLQAGWSGPARPGFPVPEDPLPTPPALSLPPRNKARLSVRGHTCEPPGAAPQLPL